nr:carbamoyltransferase HypF [Anaerolineae bacterium]
SQHIGDMGSLAALATFERARQHWQALYDLLPQALICDLHPDYHTTHLAQRLHRAQGLPLLRVQHHHAHLAALMAEHGLAGDTPVIGVCLDGTGYGTDGAIWGGEVLLADYAGCRRLAHLAYVPLPGGDAAIRHPWRSALAHLWAAGVPWADDLPPVAVASPLEKNVIARQMATGTGTVLTSSVGRLFDAVAALLDVCQHSTYEARAAAGLEALAQPAAEPYPFDLLAQPDGTSVLSPVPLLRALVADRRAGVPRSISAGRFHTTLAHMFAAACRQARAQSGVATVGLTGGVFQNVRLLTQLQAQLAADGFTVLTHEQVPAHDGGLSYGQAVVGAWRLTYPAKEDV